MTMVSMPRAPSSADAILTIPNAISAARLSTAPAFLWLFSHNREDAAVVVFGAGAFTDFLDGYIARRTGSVTNLGKLLDPLADRIFIATLVVGLATRGAIPVWLVVAVAGRDLLLLLAWPFVEGGRAARIPVSFIGKAATALLLVGLTWLALAETTFSWGLLGRRVGLPIVIAGASLYWAAAAGYARRVLTRGTSATGERPSRSGGEA
jgi:cardiolipin synthase